MIEIRQFHHARGISQQFPQQGSYAKCLVAHETMEKVIMIKSEAYVTTLKESASARCKCNYIRRRTMSFSCIIRPHNSLKIRREMAKLCWIVLPHPPYSLVLSPPDFHCFGPTKNVIHGRKFREDEVIKQAKILAPTDPTELFPTGITCSFQNAGKPFTSKKTAEKQYLYIRYVIITKLNFSSFCHFCLCCAANGFPEKELGTEQKRQIIKYWYQITCMDVEDLAKHYYKWKKINMSVGSWTK